MEKMRMESRDGIQNNIELIEKLFPYCITEEKNKDGRLVKKINFEILKQLLSSDVLEGEEAYEFSWVGKKAAMVEASKPSRKTLRPCINESVDWDKTKNLYIEGDNLEVLKLIQESYLGAIKLIYIDPPYNTGNDFVYKDDYSVSLEEYDETTGSVNEGYRLFRNTDSNGRFHSDWCSMIYSRLIAARGLLSDDGFIIISIDNNEQNNLQKICNEVFGEKNFLINICINRTSEIASNFTVDKHEYALVYAKDIKSFNLQSKAKYTISRGTVGNADQTMPIIEFPAGIPCYGLADGVYNETRKLAGSSENIENFDPIVIEHGKTKYPVRLKAKWRSSNDMRNFFQNDCKPTKAKINGEIVEIYFENDRFNPQIKKKTYEKIPSMYLENKRGSDDLKKLDMDYLFDFPKSVSLLKFFIGFTQDEDIILDFFSGSASTAHAVMQANAEDGGRRKYIMVQIPEKTEESSEAYKHGFHTICEIGKERIRRAAKKIKENLGNEDVDCGFRVLKLDESNMEDVYYTSAELKQDMLSMLESNIKKDRSDVDLLFGCILDWGLPLSGSYSVELIGNNRILSYNDGDLIACFDDDIPESIVRTIAEKKPIRAIFRDSGFMDSPSKINVDEIFKVLAPDTSIKII